MIREYSAIFSTCMRMRAEKLKTFRRLSNFNLLSIQKQRGARNYIFTVAILLRLNLKKGNQSLLSCFVVIAVYSRSCT